MVCERLRFNHCGYCIFLFLDGGALAVGIRATRWSIYRSFPFRWSRERQLTVIQRMAVRFGGPGQLDRHLVVRAACAPRLPLRATAWHFSTALVGTA